MIATILGLVGGVGGLVTAGAAALVAGYAGVRLGRWRERAATKSKIEAAKLALIAEVNDEGFERLADALRARHIAERDWVPDDDAG